MCGPDILSNYIWHVAAVFGLHYERKIMMMSMSAGILLFF